MNEEAILNILEQEDYWDRYNEIIDEQREEKKILEEEESFAQSLIELMKKFNNK